MAIANDQTEVVPPAAAAAATTTTTTTTRDLNQYELEYLSRKSSRAGDDAKRASRHLYDAMALLKQTEAPLATARAEAELARAVADAAVSALAETQGAYDDEVWRLADGGERSGIASRENRVATDAMTAATRRCERADDAIDDAQRAHDDAVRAHAASVVECETAIDAANDAARSLDATHATLAEVRLLPIRPRSRGARRSLRTTFFPSSLFTRASLSTFDR